MTEESPQVEQGRSVSVWLVPLVALVVGLLAGAGIYALASDDDTTTAEPTQAASTPAPTQTVTETPEPDVSVTIPGECVEVVDSAEQLLDLVDDAAQAVQDLSPSDLNDVLREMEDAQTELEAQIQACEDAQ